MSDNILCRYCKHCKRLHEGLDYNCANSPNGIAVECNDIRALSYFTLDDDDGLIHFCQCLQNMVVLNGEDFFPDDHYLNDCPGHEQGIYKEPSSVKVPVKVSKKRLDFSRFKVVR